MIMQRMNALGAYQAFDPVREQTLALRRALCVLDEAPAGSLDVAVLAQLHRLLLSPSEFGWGRLRDGPAVVQLLSLIHI